MSTKTYNPTTPSQREFVSLDRSALWKGRPEKTCLAPSKRTGGRNNHGRITCRHHGGGHKRRYRVIDFKRNKFGVAAKVERIEYDPFRSAFIALLRYEDGDVSYIIAPQKLNPGDNVLADGKVDIKPGNASMLKNIPVGTIVHNIEIKPSKGGQIARSAGSYAQISGKDSGYVQIKLRSGELRLVSENCMATMGAVSNPDHQNTNDGKAGRSRWKGKRPTVRGVVMNPIDHPHGGGEGRTSGGRHPVSPWGKSAKGGKTRSVKKPSSKYIVRTRHNNKKR